MTGINTNTPNSCLIRREYHVVRSQFRFCKSYLVYCSLYDDYVA